MHLQRCLDGGSLIEKLLGASAVERDCGVDPCTRGGKERQQATEAKAHDAYATRSTWELACSGDRRFDITHAGIQVERLVQGESLLPVRWRPDGEIHMRLAAPEQLRTDRDESFSCELVARRTEIRVDAENFVQDYDDRSRVPSRARVIRSEAAVR
jgi:hypothetical protein